MPEAVREKMFGWTPESKTSAIYTHLAEGDVEDAIHTFYGVKKKENGNEILTNVACPKCELLNDPSAPECEFCTFKLRDEEAKKELEDRKKAEAILNKVSKNPKYLKGLEEAWKEESSREGSD